MSRTVRVALLAAAALVVTAVTIGVVALTRSSDDGSPGDAGASSSPTEAPPSTPLAEIDTTVVALERAAFCDDVAPSTVAESLAAEVEDARAWSDGERARLAPGVRDIAHEYGCAWSGPGASEAAAWTFAPPVTLREATGLARAARETAGCTEIEDADRFGARSVALLCADPERDRSPREVSYRGLFGDAWLTCTLRVTAAEADADPEATGQLDRTGRLCAAVLDAARAG